MKVFPQRMAGMDIYKSEQMRLATRKLLSNRCP